MRCATSAQAIAGVRGRHGAHESQHPAEVLGAVAEHRQQAPVQLAGAVADRGGDLAHALATVEQAPDELGEAIPRPGRARPPGQARGGPVDDPAREPAGTGGAPQVLEGQRAVAQLVGRHPQEQRSAAGVQAHTGDRLRLCMGVHPRSRVRTGHEELVADEDQVEAPVGQDPLLPVEPVLCQTSMPGRIVRSSYATLRPYDAAPTPTSGRRARRTRA